MAALALTFTASTNAQNVVVKSPKLGTDNANPVLDFLYCADPTAVEYNGRLYVYGTNDHQQYEEAEKNSYEKRTSMRANCNTPPLLPPRSECATFRQPSRGIP